MNKSIYYLVLLFLCGACAIEAPTAYPSAGSSFRPEEVREADDRESDGGGVLIDTSPDSNDQANSGGSGDLNTPPTPLPQPIPQPAPPPPSDPADAESDLNQYVTVRCNSSMAQMREATLAIVNHFRTNGYNCSTGDYDGRKVKALRWDDSLAQASADHSLDMSVNRYFSHYGMDGSSPTDRARDAGWDGNGVGENIAGGGSHIVSTFIQWNESSGHCRNMMNSSYDAMGLGCGESGSRRNWTIQFGID